MSRTYRKRNDHWWNNSKFEYGEWDRETRQDLPKRHKTKEELARDRADGQWAAPYEHYWFNYANKVRRREERDQLKEILKYDDFEDCHFDDSRAVRIWKGIWWTIY